MNDNLGQQSNIWDKWWDGVTPLSEIRMWDFYGGRQWISKYTPRFGKIVEAGCGVGRYVFYFRKMGLDIDGVDFSQEVIHRLNIYKEEICSESKFICGDITNLPYCDDSVSGYISLGVVEHFIEGPQLALKDAFRALRPGGIAIITTPNISFSQKYFRNKTRIREWVKKILKYPPKPFFQYEYRPKTLKKFLEKEGFLVTRYEGCDLFYAFREFFIGSSDEVNDKSVLVRLASFLEKTKFRKYGAQSITISVKPAPLMYCFLSGQLNATLDSLQYFDVPISTEYQRTEIAKFFMKGRPVRFPHNYLISPPILQVEKRICSFSGVEYETDPIFEDFGFDRNVSPLELKKPEINLELCVKNLKPVYRNR
jgi:SAM-dependent methyltransferase